MHISTFCKIQTGYTQRTRLEFVEEGGAPILQMKDLGVSLISELASLSRAEVDAHERYWVRTGDVLFRSRGDKNTASVAKIEGDEAVLAMLPLVVLRPDSRKACPEFLAWSINQPASQRYFDLNAQGTSMRMISRACLDELDVDLPPLEAQRRIVELDILAEKEEQLAKRLAEKKRLLMTITLAEHAKKIARV